MKKLSLVFLSLLAGCASIIDGSHQQVHISTTNNASAKCSITGENFSDNVTIPGDIVVRRSYHPINIDCGNNTHAKVLSDVSGWGYGGAVLGLGVGAVVDTSTGDAFEYPDSIVITLGKTQTLGKTNLNQNADSNK